MSDNQLSFATLGQPVGLVTQLTGVAVVESIDGQERVVRLGDPIFFGEVVKTSNNSNITITFIDESEIVIGDESIVEINDEVYNSGDDDDLVADSSTDADAIQAAIEAGEDPTLIQDAPAAGESNIDEQNRVDVSIERNDDSALPGFGNDGISSLPTYGYDTTNGANSASGRLPASSFDNTTSNSTSGSDTQAQAGTVIINTITQDDQISSEEAAGNVTVTGTATGGDISQGDTVTLVINGQTYSTEVAQNGTWSVEVAGSDLVADTDFDAVVTSTNEFGAQVQSVGSSTHTVDDSELLINLDIDPITEDSTINANEADSTVTITGRVTGDAFESGVVTLTINGVEYTAQVNTEDGTWSVDVAGSDLAADTDTQVSGSVSVSNNIGQTGSSTTTESYFVDTGARASIRVDEITQDDIINEEESNQTVTVSGRVGFDASAGDIVSMTIGGTLYTATVQANKTWSVDVAGSDLVSQGTSFTATVSGEDDAGNPYSATTTATYGVDLEATAGTVTVNNITQDDVINATEAAQTIAVTGTAAGGDIAAGDTVTLEINGETYTTRIDEDGTWSVDVAGADLAADTAFDAVVSSSDEAGNTVESTGSSTHTVDTEATAGTVTVGAITQDDVINAQESGETIVVSGTATGGDISAGDTVTLVINDTEYSTTVDEDGTWSVDVSGADLAADTAFDAVVTSSDAAGNTVESTGSSTHTVDTEATAGTVTVGAITQDDVINAAESEQTIAVSGTASGGDIAEGDTVTLEINGETYTTTVSENGTWSVDVSGADLAADTEFDAVVTSSDDAGNTVQSTGTSTHTVDTEATAGTVTVDNITEDDVINATEAAGTVSVSGTAEGGDIASGDTVTLEINGQTYTTTVSENGTWSVDVAGSDLAADTAFDAVVSSSDAAGNRVESTGSSTHTVDTEATAGTVTVGAITQDDVINAAESEQTIAVTGTASSGDIAAGDTVTLEINGQTYTTTVSENGTWSVDVAGSDLAADTAFDAVVSSSDAAGNRVESTGSSTHTVDTEATAGTVTVGAITQDDVINAAESEQTIAVTGTASGGDIAAGDTVTLEINGETYTTTVDEDGTWSVDVAGADLAADTAFDAVVSSSDAAGNTVESTGSSTHTVDTEATAGTVTVNNITQDDVINAAESEQTITVTGTATGGDIAAGDTVTLEINGETYTTTVSENGTWSVDVAGADLAADTAFDAVVTSSDAAGNTVESTGSSTHTVDTEATAGTVTVNNITQDDVINAQESGETIVVSGTATGGDIAEGDTVTLVINDTEYTTTVDEDGTWSVDVAGSDLAADTAFDAVVSSSDAAGNTVESTGSSTHTVDTEATAGTVTVGAITQDDVINAAESEQTITVTGTATGGDIAAGDTVTLEINGETYTTTVSENGTWSVDVAGSDLAADTAFDAVVSSSDAAGNRVESTGSSTHRVDTEATAGTVTVNNITQDDVINAAESEQTIAVTGTATGGDIAAGDTVTLEINGETYTTTVDEDGTWSVDVAGSDLAADTAFDAVVSSSDAAGNTVESTGSSTHTVDTEATAGTVTVNNITQDDVINAAESEQTIAVTGTAAGGDIAAGDTVTLVINDTEYSTTVDEDGTWTVDVSGADLAADTAFDAVVTSSDTAGNTVESTGSSTHTVDTEATAGRVTVGAITQDDVINAAESEQTIAVTGTATGGDIAAGDTVTLEINGETYTTTVSENGTWSVDVAGADLAADTAFDAVVTSSDAAGNTVESTGSSTHTVDTEATAGTVTVGAITQDDVINAAESEQTIAVSGTAAGGDISAGDTVTLVINDTEYTTTVDEDGTWSVDVAGSDLAEDTAFDAVVSSSDAAGNTVESTGSSTHTVDTEATAGTVTVGAITQDDVINAAESEQTIAVTGTASGGDISAGDTVTLVINDTEYTTTVSENGTWSVDVAGSDLAADTAFDAVVSSSDAAGNTVESTGSSTHTVDLAAEAGTVIVNNITQDDVINAQESGETILVSGTATGGDIAAGDTVTLEINGQTYTTTVSENGTWSVDVAGADLAADTAFDAVVSSSDAAGNTVESTGSSTHTVDTEATAGTVTVGAITQDDVINATEAGQTIAVSGTAAGGDIAAGDTVTLVINDTEYTTTVDENGTWSVDVAGSDLAADTAFDAVVSSSDEAGNTVESTGSSTHTVDTEATAGTVTVGAITQDDVINAQESGETIAVSGTATGGDIAAGDTVTLEINGETYTTTVDEDGTWSVDVAGSDLAADTAFDAVVSSSDAAGNTVESTGSSTHTVDTEATAGTVTVGAITQDDVINATEAGQTIAVSGTASGGDIAAGDTVTLEINGQTYTTTVSENGTWSVDVAGADLAADTAFDAVVSSSDAAGNTVESTGSSTHTVDLAAEAGTLTVDAITQDDVINARESGETIAVTGTATGGDIAAGDTVTLEINGQTYTTQVAEDGTWSVDVAGADLAEDTAFDAVVSSSDAAGNTVESTGSSTHTVDTEATAGTVTVGAITQDDVINAQESGETIAVTGSASGGDIATGDTVTLVINDTEYTTTVSENGTWSVDVAGSDLAADTAFDAVVSSSDEAGNTVESTGSSTHTVDTEATAGTVTVGAITQDDVINAAESEQTIAVSGTATGGDIAAGDTVTLEINGQTYTTTVSENGTWSVDVAGADLAADTAFDAVVSSSDAAGNTVESTGSSTHTVDTEATAGTVRVGAITQDDVINAAESEQTIAVTGTATGGDISAGDTVTLEINGETYTTQVAEDGTWSVDVAGADLAADTAFDAVVSSSDAAGNIVESTGSSTHTVDTEATAGTVTVGAITQDDVINAQESGETIALSGTATGGDISAGDTVTLVINNNTYTTTVSENGTWTVDVAGSDLAADTAFDAVVASSDAAGNTVESTGSSIHTVDSEATAGTVTVGAITQDDVINAQESGETIAVSGTATGGDIAAGDTVTLEINGQTYTTTVDEDGTWSVDVAGSDLAADTAFDAVVSSSDAAGNTVESTGSSTHTVDLAAEAGTVTVNNITQDDVINATESEQTIAVSGTATGGDISVGDTVTLVINETEYSTTVDEDGTWSVDVAGADLAADTAFDAVVSSSDAAGNTVDSTGSSTHTVDTEATAGTVTVDKITEDDVINATEAGQTIAVTGTATGGDIAAGDTVTLEINGQTYTTTVAEDGTWTVDVAGSDLAADTAFDAVVTSSDAAGNTVESTGSSTHIVDLAAEAGTVTVNNITQDDVVNAQESGETILVSGTASGGDISAGDTVTLEINGQTYTTRIDEDGTWSVDVAGADLAADTEFDAVVSSSDAAGNTVESTGSSTHTVDTEATAGTVTVGAITQDDVINAQESGETILVSGTASGGDIAAGDTVTLEINGETYTTTVSENGIWSVDVAGADLAADTAFDAVVTSSDAAGNTIESTGSSTHTVDSEATAGTVTVGAITQDDVINAQESGETITVSGTATGGDISAGDTVTLVINDTEYTTTVSENGTWSVDVAGADLAADTDFDAVVSSSDAAGNTVESTGSSTHTVDTEATVGTVTVGAITQDDVINAQESGETILVSGMATGGDISVGDTVTLVINDTEYTTTVSENGTWSVDVSGADLAADTAFDAVVSSSDAADNTVESTGSSTHTVDLAAEAGTVTVNNITQDDVINASESEQTIAVTGTATGGDISAGDTVTLEINGQTYTTTVSENGTWTVDVSGADLAADTEFDAVVSSSDAAGNAVESTGSSTHTVDLAAEAGTVTVNNITQDDVINAQESGDTILVSGTATGGDIAAGDTVTLVINNTEYTTTVLENGTWSVDVAGADLAADTAFDAVVSSSDAAGNTVESTGSSTHTVDTEATAGTVTVNDITEDDVINAQESGETILVSGTASGGDISAGDTVSLEINGQTYTTTVSENGTWSVDVAGADLAADTAFDAVVTSSDAAGNTVESTGSSTHTVDLAAEAGTVTVGSITQDDVINATEAGQTIAVTGTATSGDIAAGDTVTLVINNNTYTTQVAEDGTWSVDVAGADLAADAIFDAVVTSSDAAGNSVESKATSTHTVDLTANASIDVDVITGDKLISAAEAEEGNYVSITGWVGGDARPGDTVTIELEGNAIGTAQVSAEQDSSGRYLYSVDVLGSDLANATDNPSITAKVTGTDDAGNDFVATSTEIYKVDLVADIDAFVKDESGDMVINLDEQGNMTVGGWIELGGDVQSITITDEQGNSIRITEGIDIEDDSGYGYFEIGADVSSLLDGELSVVVNASDAAGNTVQSEVMSIEKDTSAESGEVTVNAITSDDIINITESEQTVTVSGSASGGDISAGDVVTMTINGTEYSTRVQADGTWSVAVAGSDLAADTEFDVVVSSTDSAGNEVESTVSSTHTTDLSIATPSISFESTGDDSLYNADEVGEDGTVTATIAVTGSEVGDKVTYQINNNTAVTITLTAALIESGIAVEVAPEDSITVSLSDDAGNRSVEVSGTAPAADLEAEAGSVTVNAITSDDQIDGTELYDTVTVSGQASGGDITVGDQVKMVINGTEYTTTVNDDGSWSVNVAASELAEDTEFDVVVTSSDAAGNTVESRGTSTHTVDLSTEVTLSAGEGQQVVLTGLPEGFVFPDGVTQVTTDFGATISLVDGEYLYQAPVRDHSDSQGDQDSVTVTLDDGRSFIVNIDVEDSVPVAVDDQTDITVRRETFEVSGVEANWVSRSGGTNVWTFDGNDNDDGDDQIRWGHSANYNGAQSGYGFVDNDAELDGHFELNEDIVLGTFTHYNYPIFDGGAINAASMTVDFALTDDLGTTESVQLTVNFSHNETLNVNGDEEASRDIVTVENTFVTFEWEGDIYTLQVVGFREVGNPDGEIITSIHTYENASTSYELVVRVVEGEGYSLPETTGNVFDDNGLGADELSQDGSISVTNVAAGNTVDVDDFAAGQSVEGEYGRLTLNADGSYEYLVTASVSNIPSGATETFTYMIQDQDGSTASATLSINVGLNNTPEAFDDTFVSITNGLKGEYFGFNEQIDNLTDFKNLISNSSADAEFVASNIAYQYGTGNVSSGSNLQNFLGSDAASLSNDPATTSDGGMRLSGYVYLEAGSYNFKVYADDGYQITLDGNVVASASNNQIASEDTFASFTIAEDGYYAIEMLWWDQGGDHVFQPEISDDGGVTYSALDSSSLTASLSSTGGAITMDPSELLSNDTDLDGDTLNITSVSNAQHGYVYMDATGKIIFIPEVDYSGNASFDYRISDGKGGESTASVNLSVQNTAASITVDITEVAAQESQFNAKSDVITNATHIESKDYDNWVRFDNSDHQIDIGDDIEASLQTGSGDDSIYVKDDLKGNGYLSTGSGDDKVFIGDKVDATMETGAGDDSVTVGGSLTRDGYINLGSGNDTLSINGNLLASVHTGSNDDYVVIKGLISQGYNQGYISGGAGTDSIVLESYTLQDYQNNKDNIKYQVSGFENIMLADGLLKGDENAFNNSSTAGYSVAISVADLAQNENVESITITGVPDDAKLQQNGEDLTENSDGSYTVTLSEGQTEVDDLLIVSTTDQELGQFDLAVTANTSDVNDGLMNTTQDDYLVGSGNDDYLEGGVGEDNILGNLGDDVLFGGEDNAVDSLTGGEGNDIFILNNDDDLSDGFTQDLLVDFNMNEDSLDISDLLDLPNGTDSEDADAITAFLESNVSITEDGEGAKHLTIGSGEEAQDVAVFGDASNVAAGGTISVVFNNQEYDINIDG
ncbi:Ig-like domain-containing protein [Marinomonas sp. THO17]|uniref:Ig-like domain-containing protein n=1 Tax=Marinomonas sp. THO17 TaxID=3149048 RepID=UPI00336C1FAB